jgi:hypothetical protein
MSQVTATTPRIEILTGQAATEQRALIGQRIDLLTRTGPPTAADLAAQRIAVVVAGGQRGPQGPPGLLDSLTHNTIPIGDENDEPVELLTTATGRALLVAANQAAGRTAIDAEQAGAASTVQGNLDTHIGLTGTDVHGLGALSTQDTITASQISDSTETGRALLVAANEAAGRTAIDAEQAGAASTVQGNLDTHIGLTGTAVHGLGGLSTQDTITASQISDSTETGRALLVAANEAAGRTAIDAEQAGAASTVQGNLDTHIGLTGTAVHGLGGLSTQDTITASQISDSGTKGRALIALADDAALQSEILARLVGATVVAGKLEATSTAADSIKTAGGFLGTSLSIPRGTGVDNECYGTGAGAALTTGRRNVLVGAQAGQSITTGESNVVMGRLAAAALVDGSFNVAIGESAMGNNIDSSTNTAIGLGALRGLTGGPGVNSNCALGLDAGRRTNAGADATAIRNGIYIGRDSRALSATADNEIVIARDGRGNGSHTATIGNSDTVSNHFFGRIHSEGGTTPAAQSAGHAAVGNGVVRAGTQLRSDGTAADAISSAGGVTLAGDIIASDTSNIYLGPSGTDGSWRMVRSGNNLVFQRRESGSWVTKSTISA